MDYIPLVVAVIISIHTLSYAKYNWDRKNRFSALGCIFLALLSILMQVLNLFQG